MADLIGLKLGQYEITSLLGEGGMATVYRARQLNVKRDVAIKIIESRLARNPDFIKRFEREAQTIAALNHPHILKLFDFGQLDDLLYLVMELQPGGSLASLIRRGNLPLEQVEDLLGQIASALDYAHEQGIIHRDLKPQNVLLDAKGHAILTDFGIAKVLNDTTALTASGMAMGTPSYMSPEQWQGQTIDTRSDLYALGVMLFEMISNQLPFSGDTPAIVMYRHLQEPPPPISSLRPDIPDAVEQVLNKALAKDPARRFQSANEMAKAFKAAISSKPQARLDAQQPTTAALHPTTVQGGQITPLAAEKPQSGRSPLLIGGALVVVALIAVVGFLLLRGQASTATPTATTAATAAAALTTPTQQAVASVTATLTSTTAAPVPTTVEPTRAVATAVPPTATTDIGTLAAATIAREVSLTAQIVASYTKTMTPTIAPTLTATQTLNQEQTLAAIVAATRTALAPTITWTPSITPTPTETDMPLPAQILSIGSNHEWTPVVRSFRGVKMVLVPPGCFMMGSTTPIGNPTFPLTKVCFDKPFWIDMFEVSNQQFKGLSGISVLPESWQGDQNPRDNISWLESRTFCELRGARLPTEAEWEYASRGPDGLEYPWGNNFKAENVIYAGNSNAHPAPVGSKPDGKSWVGAYDLSGNLWEWTNSLYKPYPYDGADGRETGSDTGEMRTLRGGSFTIDALGLRLAARNVVYPTAGRSADGGFRCARSFDGL